MLIEISIYTTIIVVVNDGQPFRTEWIGHTLQWLTYISHPDISVLKNVQICGKDGEIWGKCSNLGIKMSKFGVKMGKFVAKMGKFGVRWSKTGKFWVNW